MASKFLICAVLAVTLGASSAAAACSNYFYCNTCTGIGGCGWNGAWCVSGSSSGPTYSYDNTGTWTYYSSGCNSWSTGSYYVSYSFWSVSSYGLWLCVAGFVLFWGAVCSCCWYRRRRVYVATTISQPINSPGYVVGVQQTTYAPVPAAYGQPAYAQPAPMQQASPYGQPAPQQASPYGQPSAPGYAAAPNQQPACQPAPAPQPTGGIYGA